MDNFNNEVWEIDYISLKSNRTVKHVYELSDYGRYKKDGEIIILKNTNGHGYIVTPQGKYLHRRVAEKFLTDWDPTKQVDHIDGNRQNNMASNLRMATATENVNNPITKERNKLAHQTEEYKKKMCGPNNPFYGKKHPPEIMEQIRQKNLGRTPWNKGKKGLQHNSEEQKRLNSIRVSNSNWMNNTIEERLIQKEDQQEYLNSGWSYGRIY